MSYFSKTDESRLRKLSRQIIADITASFTLEQEAKLDAITASFTAELEAKLKGIKAGATVGGDDINRIMTANNGDVVTANDGDCMVTN